MSYPTWSDLNSPSIVPPLGSRQAPDIGPAALMVSTEADLRLLSGSAGGMTTRPFYMGTVMTDTPEGSGIAIAGPYIGSPYAVMLMESLIAKGARRIIILGWCGAISPALAPGDLVVPSTTLVDEGTSRHYMVSDKEPAVCVPDHSLSETLTKRIEAAGETVHSLPVWTTDAIYRETREKVAWFRDKGAHAVEMECSALFAVAAYRRVRAAALLVVSDSLAGDTGKWAPAFKNKRFKAMRKFACKTAMATTRTLAE
ncbi:MAG: nucleoside phosphorylase [Desulfobacter sp.]